MAEGTQLGSAYVTIGLNSSQFQQGLAALKGQTVSAVGSMNAIATTATQSLYRLIGVTTGIYALQKGFRSAIDAAVGFDKSMHNVWTTMDGTAADMVAMGVTVRGMGRAYATTARETANALYEIYQATFYGADAMTILNQALKGSIAGLTGVQTTADMLTTVLQAYRMSATEAAHVNDVLFATVIYGKVTYEELAGQFGRLAGIAAPLGASMEEVSAAIMTLTRQGIQADWAITALRQALMQIMRPAAGLKEALAKMGYETGRAMIESVGFAGAIAKIKKYSEETATPLEHMFTEVRSITAILPLVTTASGEYAKDLVRVAEAAGMAEVALGKQRQSLSFQLNQLRVMLNDFGITVGTLLVPAIQGLGDVLTPVVALLKVFAEALNVIGGAYTVRIVAALGAIALGWWGIHKAVLATTAAMTMGTLGGANLGAKMGGLLYQLGRGSMLKGLGAIGIGIAAVSTTIKGIANLDIAVSGKVTGAEKARAEIEGSIETALGPIIGGAVIGGIFGGAIGAIGGAGIGAAIAVASGITIWVKHMIVKGEEAAVIQETELGKQVELSRPEARKLLLGIELPKEMKGVYALDDLAEQILELKGVTSPSVVLVAALTREIGSFYNVTEDWAYTINETADGARRLTDELSKLIPGFGLAQGVAESFFASVIETYNKVQAGPKITPENMSVDAIVQMIQQSAQEAAKALNLGDLGVADVAKIAAFAAQNMEFFQEKLRKVADESGFSGSAIEGLADKINSVAIEMDAAADPIAWAKAAGEMGALGQAIGKVTANIPGDARMQVISDIISLVGYMPEDILALLKSKMGVTEQEYADYLARLIAGKSNIPEIRTTAEQAKDALGIFKTIFIDLTDGNTTLIEAETEFKKLETGLDEWARKLVLVTAAGDPATKSIQDLVTWLTAIVDPAKKAADEIKSWSTRIKELIATLQSPSSTMEAKIAATQSLQQMGGEIYDLAQDPQYSQFKDALMGLVGAIEDACVKIVGADVKMQEAWDNLSKQFMQGDLSLEGLIVRMKSAAGATGDTEEGLRWLYDQLTALSSSMESGVTIQKLFQTKLGISAEAADALAEWLDTAAAAAADFASKIAAIDLSGITAGIDALLAELGTKLAGAGEFGEVAEILSDIGVLGGATKSFRENVEKFFDAMALDPDYAAKIKTQWGESFDANMKKLQDAYAQTPILPEGRTAEQQASDAERAAEEARRAQEEAARAAEQAAAAAAQAAKDAATAQQKAFQKMFKVPALEALKTGGWAESAVAVMGLAKNFEKLVSDAEALSNANGEVIDRSEVLGLVLGAQGDLLSALDQSIELGKLAGDSVSGLEEFKLSIEELFDPLGALKKKLREIAGDVLGAPKAAAGALRNLAMGIAGRSPVSATEDLKALSKGAGDEAIADVKKNIADVVSVCTGDVCYEIYDAAQQAASDAVTAAAEGTTAPSGPVPAGGYTLEGATQEVLAEVSTCANGICGKLDKTAEKIQVTQKTFDDLSKSYGLASDEVSKIYDALSTGNAAALEGILADAEEGGPAWRLIMDAISEGQGSIEQLMSDYETLGLSTEDLEKRLDEFAAALQNKEYWQVRLQRVLTDWGNVISKGVGMVFGGEAGSFIGTAISGVTSFLTGNVAGVISSVLDAIGQIVGWVTESIKKSIEEMKKAITELAKTVWGIASFIGKFAWKGITDTLGLIADQGQRAAAALGALAREADSVTRIEAALATIRKGLMTTLLGFLLPIAGILEQIAGLFEEEANASGDLNVPSGWKAERIRYAASTPGEAPVTGGAGKELPGWLTDIFEQFKDQIAAIITPIKAFISALEDAWKKVAPAIISGILPVIQTFVDMLKPISDWITATFVPDLQKFFGGFASWWTEQVDPFLKSDVFPQLGEWFTAIYTFIKDQLLPFLAGEFFTFLKDVAWPIFTTIVDSVGKSLGSLFAVIESNWPILDVIFGRLGQSLMNIIDAIGRVIDDALLAIIPVADTLSFAISEISFWISNVLGPDLENFLAGFGEWWRTDVDPFLRSEVFPTLGRWITEIYTMLRDNFGPVLSNIWNWMKTEVWDKISVFGDKIGGFFEWLGNWITNNWDSIERVLNLIIDRWIKNMEKQLEKIEYYSGMFENLPKNVQDMVASWLLGQVGVPGFAEGGVVYKPTLAMVGEKGPELITPLDQLGSMAGSFGGDNRTVEIHVHVGNEKLAKYVMKGLKNANVYDTGFALSPMGG